MERGALSISGSEHRLRSENLAFDIDVWYPALSEHTFPTSFLPLTLDEARAILAYNDVSWRAARVALTRDEVATLERLERRIDAKLHDSFGERGAFLRLCGRSPKDGEPTDERIRAAVWDSYQSSLTQLVEKEHQPLDGNTRLAAVSRTRPWLRVRTGAEAMSLLLTSERVFADMRDWLEYGEPEQIVLREWSSRFTMATEFRCYVERGELLAISQYDTYVRYHELQPLEQREAVVRAVVSEWHRVKSRIETLDGSYCVDFGVDLQSCTAQLIELSPFRSCTGPALFSWDRGPMLRLNTDSKVGTSDLLLRGVLSHGSIYRGADTNSGAAVHADIASSAVLRTRSAPIPGIEELVEANWDCRWRPLPRACLDEGQHEPINAQEALQLHRPVPHTTLFAKAAVQEYEAPAPAPLAQTAKRLFLGCIGAATVLGGAASAAGSVIDAVEVEFAEIACYSVVAATAALTGVVGLKRFCWDSQQRRVESSSSASPSETAGADAQKPVLLFVYGTLKRGCHWHSKHLQTSRPGAVRFICDATTTQPQRLVLGDCGVPYLLHSTCIEQPSANAGDIVRSPRTPRKVRGELFAVDTEALAGIDEYEGVSKGHYRRLPVSVTLPSGATSEAQCYFYSCTPGAERRQEGGVVVGTPDRQLLAAPSLSEYTLVQQQQLYKPIKHIQVKQAQYLQEAGAEGVVMT